MYLAFETKRRKTRYILRESYREGESWKSRDLLGLKKHPAQCLHYLDDRVYYLDPEIEEGLRSKGVNIDDGELDFLFRPFVKPHIREKVERFERGRSGGAKKARMGYREMCELQKNILPFDKRRLHFLRFGRMDQGNVAVQPHGFFNILLDKSRDELEHMFMEMEQYLRTRELKQYVYVIFDIQRHFSNKISRFFPFSLDQERIEELFVDELCSLSRNPAYKTERKTDYVLRTYLKRYLVMFFDFSYGAGNPVKSYIDQFMNAHRFFRPPKTTPKKSDIINALRIFDIDEKELSAMDEEAITRAFRKKAHTVHPDKGGDHNDFVKLVDAFDMLLEVKRSDTVNVFRRRR